MSDLLSRENLIVIYMGDRKSKKADNYSESEYTIRIPLVGLPKFHSITIEAQYDGEKRKQLILNSEYRHSKLSNEKHCIDSARIGEFIFLLAAKLKYDLLRGLEEDSAGFLHTDEINKLNFNRCTNVPPTIYTSRNRIFNRSKNFLNSFLVEPEQLYHLTCFVGGTGSKKSQSLMWWLNVTADDIIFYGEGEEVSDEDLEKKLDKIFPKSSLWNEAKINSFCDQYIEGFSESSKRNTAYKDERPEVVAQIIKQERFPTPKLKYLKDKDTDFLSSELIDPKTIGNKTLDGINKLLTQKSKEHQISQVENKLEELASSLVNDSYSVAEKIEELIKNRNYRSAHLLVEDVSLFVKRAKQASDIPVTVGNKIEAKISKIMALLFLQRQEYDSAIEQLEQVLSINPRDPAAKLNMAFALYSVGRYNDAIKAYDELILWQPDNYEAYDKKGRLLIEMNEHGKATKCYEKVVELMPNSCSAWMALSLSFNATGQYKMALQSIDRAIDLDQYQGIPWFLKGIIYSALFKSEEAYKSLKKGDELSPELSPIIGLTSLLGMVSFEMGNLKESCILLEKATKEDPKDYSAWCHYAYSLYFSQQYEAAIEAINKSLEGEANSRAAWAVKGFSETMLKRYEDAISSLEKANLYRDKPSSELLMRLGLCLKEVGKFKNAVEILEQAVSVEPNQSSSWYLLGEIYCKLRAYQKSLDAFNHILKSDPENYEALIYKSRVLTHLGFSQDSLNVLKQAIEVDSRRLEAYMEIGAKLSVFGRHKNAIPYFRRMIYSNPSEVKWYVILAMLMKHKGKNFESKGLLKIAKKLSPGCLEDIYWIIIFSSSPPIPFAATYARLVQKIAIVKYNCFKSKIKIEFFGKLKW